MIRYLLILFSLHYELFSAELTVSITHQYEGRPVLLDSFRYKTAKSEVYSLTRISYLLSGFKLERPDGTMIYLPDQHAWIDLKKNTSFTLTKIPAGDYRAIHYHIGLDPKTNHLDPAIYPADHPLSSLRNLHWNWAEGYIFMAIEGHQLIPEKGETPISKKGFIYHFANDDNLTSISLPHSLSVGASTKLELLLDLQSVINSPRPVSFLTDGNISHSGKNDTVAKKLRLNLKNSFSISKSYSNTQKSPPPKNVKPLHMPQTFTPYPFTIPRHIPIPHLPRDNPLTNDRVALGKKLFHDTRLSKDNTISCATCHQHQHALSDSRALSLGVDHTPSLRNSMPLQNLAWKNKFFWDGRVTTLREQVIFPITDKSEMHQDLSILPSKINNLRPLFEKAFGNKEITTEKIALALEAHLLTLTSLDSKFDQVAKGKATLTEQEQRGFELFFTENNPRTRKRGADCFHCHSGPFFSDESYHNTGLSSLIDTGLNRVTGKKSDQYKFLTPSLRNVALTGPYMHDGRLKNLEEVIDHYNHINNKNPNLDPNLSKHGTKGLQLTKEDKSALIAFLKTLTDPKFQKRSSVKNNSPKP